MTKNRDLLILGMIIVENFSISSEWTTKAKKFLSCLGNSKILPEKLNFNIVCQLAEESNKKDELNRLGLHTYLNFKEAIDDLISVLKHFEYDFGFNDFTLEEVKSFGYKGVNLEIDNQYKITIQLINNYKIGRFRLLSIEDVLNKKLELFDIHLNHEQFLKFLINYKETVHYNKDLFDIILY